MKKIRINRTSLILLHTVILEVFFMQIKKYNREKVVEYARKWAYSRNKKYYNFDSKIGRAHV